MWDNSITEYTIVYINGITGIINVPNICKNWKISDVFNDDFSKFIDKYENLYGSCDLIFTIY